MSRVLEQPLPGLYWLTRDRMFGELANYIEVWVVEPSPHRHADGDVVWFANDDVDNEDTCIGELSLEQARRIVGNGIPDTERECIRVGPGPTRASA